MTRREIPSACGVMCLAAFPLLAGEMIKTTKRARLKAEMAPWSKSHQP